MKQANSETLPARQTWSAGDFPRMGVELAIVGELLCESIPVHAGDPVLDVGTASGNTAISAARRRAIVTGVDLVPALLGHARMRAQTEGFEIDFQEGNAMALSFADESFDVVLSTFGAIFAPDPHKTAAENGARLPTRRKNWHGELASRFDDREAVPDPGTVFRAELACRCSPGVG
ncbi:MAG: class I SAM-dependent methyltransferase [Bryobacteraceae bacterium]|jgi:SAM-dependent methyltransferase